MKLQALSRATTERSRRYVERSQRETFTKHSPSSQVGSMVVREIYKRFAIDEHAKAELALWLRLMYSKLLSWNRWFWEKRNENGMMVWGTSPNPPSNSTYQSETSVAPGY